MRIVKDLFFATTAILIGGCGPDVVGAAATNATLQATQVQQAKAQAQQITKNLDAAMKSAEVAASAAQSQ